MSGELNLTFIEAEDLLSEEGEELSEKDHLPEEDKELSEKDHLSEEDKELSEEDHAQLVESNDCRKKSLNMLKSSLTTRISELEDEDQQTAALEGLDQLCSSIEKETWLFLDNSPFTNKYNCHIRALFSNIKDKDNGDFFRAILSGKLTPSEIARLKPADMASDAKKERRSYESKKNLYLHVSEALDVCRIKATTKPIVKTHKGDFEIEKPLTDEACSSLTSEFVRTALPEGYLQQEAPLPKKPTLLEAAKKPCSSKQALSKGVESASKKRKIFPVSRVASTNFDSYSNFGSHSDDIHSFGEYNRQNVTPGSSMSPFYANSQPQNYQNMNVQPQHPMHIVNQTFFIDTHRQINISPRFQAHYSPPKPTGPPSPGCFLNLKMRLRGIVAKFGEMRVKARIASSSQPTSPPSSSWTLPPSSTLASPSSPPLSSTSQEAQTQPHPKIPEIKILSNMQMRHDVPNVNSYGQFFGVIVHNMYGNLAEKDVFMDPIWQNKGGMIVKKHVPPDGLMSHLEYCLKPDCPEEISDEVGVVSIHLARQDQSQAYEDLFTSLDSSGMLGVLNYMHRTEEMCYVRRVYIYALNKLREVHSPLKALLGSALPPREERSNMLLGIFVMEQILTLD